MEAGGSHPLAQRSLGLGAQVVDPELEHPSELRGAAAAAVAIEGRLELPRARESLGERLLDHALERQLGEDSRQVDDRDSGW